MWEYCFDSYLQNQSHLSYISKIIQWVFDKKKEICFRKSCQRNSVWTDPTVRNLRAPTNFQFNLKSRIFSEHQLCARPVGCNALFTEDFMGCGGDRMRTKKLRNRIQSTAAEMCSWFRCHVVAGEGDVRAGFEGRRVGFNKRLREWRYEMVFMELWAVRNPKWPQPQSWPSSCVEKAMANWRDFGLTDTEPTLSQMPPHYYSVHLLLA